jgi:hypothetical protein
MNPRLKELINNADDGVSDAITLAPRTLKAILQELEKMCHSSDSILCEPVPGGNGFKISAKNDGRFKREFREFHIEPAGAFTVAIYNGTLFGSLPTGFSVNDSPIATLAVANGNKIYAKITWNRTMSNTGDIVSTITARTIEAAATVPANDPAVGTRHYQLATVAVTDAGTVSASQTRWGPIDDLPGTARWNYAMNSASTSAQTDYWDLLATGKGKQAGGATDLAPTYDSVQVAGYGGWLRFIQDGTNLKIFARGTTMNSVGQITYIGPEYVVFNRPVVCETTVDVLVGLRLNGGYLEGQYRTIKVNAVATPSPEWVSTGIPVTAGTTIQCV